MEDNILKNVFDPSWFKVQPREGLDSEEKETRVLSRSEFEKLAYEEVVNSLKEDLAKLSIPVNYATKIIIGEIAMNIILISRIKWEFVDRPVVYRKNIIRPSNYRSKLYAGEKSVSYDIIAEQEIVHPVYSEFLPKLERELNKQLSLLGLLPQQQIERQKVILVEKLKKRLIDIRVGDDRYTTDAIITKS